MTGRTERGLQDGAPVVEDLLSCGAHSLIAVVRPAPPKATGQAAVHHLGVQTDELEAVVERLRSLGVSITDIRREAAAAYAMAEGPDGVLVEIFQPDSSALPAALRDYFEAGG